MRNATGASDRRPLRPVFDRRLKLELHGSRVTSDAGPLACRKLREALGLAALAGDVLADSRTGKTGCAAGPRTLPADILRRTDRLRPKPLPA